MRYSPAVSNEADPFASSSRRNSNVWPGSSAIEKSCHTRNDPPLVLSEPGREDDELTLGVTGQRSVERGGQPANSRWLAMAARLPLGTQQEAILVARRLNDIHGLGVALYFVAILSYIKRNAAEVERLASDLIEHSTRQNIVHFRALGTALLGWARSASGRTAEGMSWI
jgi:hypothetical protein